MRLQAFNNVVMNRIEDGEELENWLDSYEFPLGNTRVTIFSHQGKMLFDNVLDTLSRKNHLNEPELAEALKKGSGHAIHSTPYHSTPYFYSAVATPKYLIRSGLPNHSITLKEVLNADIHFLWVIAIVFPISLFLVYIGTRNISRSLRRLNDFATAIEENRGFDPNTKFPNDELGNISRNLVTLYGRLQHTAADRDRKELMVINEEQEKLQIKKDLTNNINHELKTPVASIQVCIETLIDHPDLPEKTKQDFMERIHSNTRRLGSLLRDISTITRLDEASNLISKEQINLKELVDEVISDASLRASGNDLTLINRLPDSFTLNANQPLMESVFRNLLENAIAYSGGTMCEVALKNIENGIATITVTDDGVGIPEIHHKRIFERFYRIDKGRSRKAGGTGLGLAIVRNTVLFHGGDITLRNLPSGGLEFTITLPID